MERPYYILLMAKILFVIDNLTKKVSGICSLQPPTFDFFYPLFFISALDCCILSHQFWLLEIAEVVVDY